MGSRRNLGRRAVAERLYARLPVPLQHAAVTAFGYHWRRTRLGGPFDAYRKAAAGRERWTVAQWKAYETESLRRLIEVARGAPWYAMTLDNAQASLEDLPIVTKDDLRHDPTSFVVGGRVPRGALVSQTSGSTGTPLELYDSRDDMRRAVALRDARYLSLAGVDYSMPRATFSGRRVEPASDSTGPFHRFNRAEGQLYFSPYHLGPMTVERYVDALWRHRPVWLTGYAGSISELGRLASERGLELPPARAVITSAEPVPEWLRLHCPEVFGCSVTEEYGMAEQVCLAVECPAGSLHVFPDAGIVEILDTDGRRCVNGEVGEIVATSFIRWLQPLIRYRTGDLGALSDEGCSCGRQTPILAALEGRVDDIVVGADGRRVGRLSHVPKGLPGVIAMQFVQRRAGAIAAHVVATDVLDDHTRSEIRTRLLERLGSGTAVDVIQVSELQRTARGKIRGVIRDGGDR
jgi:phenylacetate-CoA ligase